MFEAPALAPASTASGALDAQTPTPIAQLTPELPDRESRVIDGVVTITWPYSIVTRSAAFILAEHDFRLRHARGQLRLEFHGPVGQRIADAGIGGGDGLRISLEGAQWEAHKSQTRVPGTILEWQFRFTSRLLMRVQRADNQETEVLDLNLPDDANQDDALLATITPQGSSPLMHSSLFTTEVISTPGAHSPDYNLPTKRPASSAFESAEYASPAFLKRARVSYGSLFEDGFDIFDEDVAKKKKKTKRSRFSMGATGWKYSSRSPSPEPQVPETHELESDLDGEDEEKPDKPDIKAIKSPIMVDESAQTQDTSFAAQVAEQARDSASLIPSSPTPMTFGKPEEPVKEHFPATAFGAPSTAKDETVSAFGQPSRPLFGGTTNIFAPATTATPPKSNIFASSWGNSGFSVEHTTTASSSSIPVFNDSLAESIRSREAAEERVPGEPEPAFDEPADEVPQSIDLGFEIVGSEKLQDTDAFTVPEFPQPDSIRNPFAVEPFPEPAVSAEEPEEDIYEANTYPQIQDEEPDPEEPKRHAFDLPPSSEQMRDQAARQNGQQEEQAEEDKSDDDDESTDYEIEAADPPKKLERAYSEEQVEEEDDQEEDDQEEDDLEEYDEDAEGYDDEEPGFNEHYAEEDEEHYDEDEEDEEEEDEDDDEPASRAPAASQDPVVISLLSDSEDEEEPAASTPAPAVKSEVKTAQDEEPDEDEGSEAEDENEDEEDDMRQPSEEEEYSDGRASSPEDEVVEKQEEEVVEDQEEKLLEGSEEEVIDKQEGEGDEGVSAEEHSEEVDLVGRLSEDRLDAEPEIQATEDAAPSEEDRKSVDEMDVDEDDDNVSLIPMVEPERPLEEPVRGTSPVADVQEMSEAPSEPVQAEEQVTEEVKDADDVEVTEAPEVTEAMEVDEDMDEIKSQPDVDMDVKEPEEIVVLVDSNNEVVAEMISTEQNKQEAEDVPIAETVEESTAVGQIKEAAKKIPALEAPVEDQPLEDAAQQLEAEAEAAAPIPSTRATRSSRNQQLPTPIDTQIPVAEAAEIEIVQSTPEQPRADEEMDEDDLAAQQIMGEFLQHASPKQEQLPPPPPPSSAKEHRRKRSDTLSETGRRTRSQTKHQQPGEEHEAEAPTSSPRSHRRSSRSVDKTNDTTGIATSVEPSASFGSKHGDKTPLLQRSFRITRSRGGATEQTDPSVAIAKAAATSSSKSPEHTPSRPIMLRVTRSMENIAEAGLKEGLVIPEASVRSVRLDDASSTGTRSGAGTPMTPSTQMQIQTQTQQEQRYARRPSESPASAGDRSPSIAQSPPPDADGNDAGATTASALKMQLQRDLRTTLPDNLALASLRTSLGKTADVIAVAVSTPSPPYRPKNGPRDYMLELLLVDPSSAPRGVHVAHIFRPHQQSLPAVQAGDVVLLRGMTVVSVKDRGFGLRVGDASAWAVFDERARAAGRAGDVVLPQIKGPPVQLMEAEVQYATGLARWWALLDQPTMGRIERAAQKMLALS
ncbi:hypothetical protein PWT90_02436 [Aphanocladium album]|nr:hypothetical protein PWT90_02436 [Aphanocladium album]